MVRADPEEWQIHNNLLEWPFKSFQEARGFEGSDLQPSTTWTESAALPGQSQLEPVWTNLPGSNILQEDGNITKAEQGYPQGYFYKGNFFLTSNCCGGFSALPLGGVHGAIEQIVWAWEKVKAELTAA